MKPFLILAGFLSMVRAVSMSAEEMPSRPAPTPAAYETATYFLGGADSPAAQIDLTTALSAKSLEPDAPPRPGLLRIGKAVDLDDVHTTVSWSRGNTGIWVGRFKVRSAGAAGLRLQLRLPAGVRASALLAAANENGRVERMEIRDATQSVWTPYTDGEEQLVELVLAAGAVPPRQSQVRIESVSHFEVSALTGLNTSLAKELSGSCNVDVKCPSSVAGLSAAIEERKKSVMQIIFRSGTSTFTCSGTLINSDRFPRAFILTANHCISTAQEAASITTNWFKENSACGVRDSVSGQVQVAGGAQLLFTNFLFDSTLLELNTAPPAGAMYAGWTSSLLNQGDPVVSISHPRGDPMKYAEGTISTSFRSFDYPAHDMYAITYSRGVIEGGSSGSGLFILNPNSGLQLAGILSGTSLRSGSGLSCTNQGEFGIYGRFESFLPNIRNVIQNVAVPAVDIDPNQPTSSIRDIPLGGRLTARIDHSGDLDVFRIVVLQPGHLTVRTTGGDDLIGALLDVNGAGLAAEDDAQRGSFDFGLTYRVTTPGIYYLSIGHFESSGTTGDYGVEATFSTATDNYSDIWWNQNESGWGLALNHQDNILAGALYTFDTDGQPLFLILNGAARQVDGSYLGNLNRPSGPAFNTAPWPVSQVQNTNVGTMRLRFPARDTLNIDYNVGAINVSKSLTRLTYATAPKCNFNGFNRSYANNYQDIWWNPNESGWGLNIIHQGDILTVGLYTYDSNGRNVWYLMAPGSRQAGTNIFSGPLKRITGPVFNTVPWTSVQESSVGTMSINFTNGNLASLTYTLNGVTVNKQIQRLAFANPATQCERD